MKPRTLLAIACGAVVILACTRAPRAQGGRISPHETVSATIDGSEMSIVYGRPYMRGRTIFGGLVPYGIVWCPGADEATMLATSKALRVGDLALPAGEYTLWILPTEDVWTLVVNKEAHVFHTQYRSRSDLGRVRMEKRTLAAPVEQLTFAIEKNGSKSGGKIAMTWATTEASVPFVVEQ